ncbi:xanthine dehydrogenase accessory protein XdhC [Maritimibacter sp. 55A14]|uniref:xanthine dehydrogenase accessory protein XdhC n=1 Tax=Maritimibacter sp. 55A14 TaxID=2174844 RepID=UPI000D604FEA|nr:xanthine dehydrogenase accessory protein XdhC [Maritimibacter sp. 55A14]PWE32095.1 xanthine dehydrogenase accessory protein XdhC [Maritimibacter sp. 55A14]
MSFDAEALRAAIARHGPVARVVIAEVAGSAPREPGAAMLVWPGGQSGTIGGGALEWEAAGIARDRLAAARAAPGHEYLEKDEGRGAALILRRPLGPALGQCCGGAVVLVVEIFAAVPEAEAGVVARPVSGAAEMPLALRRLLAQARSGGHAPVPQLLEGWMVEPLSRAQREIWIWGAGHVGRALVATLAPLPEFAITWVDTAADRFPEDVRDGITQLVAVNPADLVAHAPATAEHLVLTYSHALDLELCHRLLGHGFARAGLIGSATKWARFRRRLRQLGHSPARISRIDCPIGDPALGKHPRAIAIGVASEMLRPGAARQKSQENRA